MLCSCNGTMPLDAAALAKALDLDAPPALRTMMCQKELAGFAAGATGDLLVACTQEARLLGDVAEEGGKAQSIRFVNIRENGGWSAEAAKATPKIAALLAAAAMPEPDPVPRVAYASSGQLLVVGPLREALKWAQALADALTVTVLASDTADEAELPAQRDFAVYSGTPTAIDGWLGAFDVAWTQDNPIDLDLCTRCNACIEVCPEAAIDWRYQIDLDKCRDHRKCVAACGAIGAIDFDRAERARRERFDIVLDLRGTPWFTQHQPPQGYYAPGNDPLAQAKVAAELATLRGEFEKPKFFRYKASICAHSRSRQTGCTQCIDVCSTRAIRADGDHVEVEPHLCMGCGACATVCPSGAMAYAYPGAADLGSRVRTLLAAYAKAGGRDACLLLHAEEGRDALARLARRGKGLPARVVPVEVHHMASVGLDTWLAALAWGASSVAVLALGSEAPQYAQALRFQMTIGDAIANTLGYQGEHFRVVDGARVETLERDLWTWPPPLGARIAATFAPVGDKRTALGLALDHLALHAPVPQQVIALPAGAPFGAIAVDRDACTMCLACVGACPVGAIIDNPETPQLRLLETKCVQCGICATTCPEHAITLVPQLDLTPAARAPRVLNVAQVVACTRCGKPLGTQKLIEAMLARLAGHSMFAEPGAIDRLKMCADCRVVDMMQSENSLDVRKL
ncbi:MAG: 4Fe-4S binding protein [Casimicrobiaceae bacterium]